MADCAVGTQSPSQKPYTILVSRRSANDRFSRTSTEVVGGLAAFAAGSRSMKNVIVALILCSDAAVRSG
jgi:hypothetical protein